MRLLAALVLCLLFAGAARSVEGLSFGEREALAKLQAMDLFPDLEDEGSQLAKLVADQVITLEREQPAFFKEPAWPVRVARRAAGRLGIAPRTVAQIRASVSTAFDIDPVEFRRIHGIRIVSARFTTGGEWLDVTPQIAKRVVDEGLVVECVRTLAATLADESQFERNRAESKADYWQRQRNLLAAATDAREGRAAIEISFEFESEHFTATAKEGERLVVSEDGQVVISKIAPAARVVKKNGDIPGAKPAAPAKGRR